MATTHTNLERIRWTLTGISGPQPLAGTATRAAEAFAAMAAASWKAGGEPCIPAHKVKTAAPTQGDAYRQTWGYDAATSTERSACGAVCYSFKIPNDALTGDPCSVTGLSASLSGDRWLECGAILTALVSGESVPPSFGYFIENAESTAALLIPADTDGQGRAIEPNKRADTSATATLAFATPPAAAQWLHVMLRVADYTAVRGAWHEGGAMLDPDSVSVTFSRDVALPTAPADITLSIGNTTGVQRIKTGTEPDADYNPNTQTAGILGLKEKYGLAFAILLPPNETVKGVTAPMKYSEIGMTAGQIDADYITFDAEHDTAYSMAWGFDVVSFPTLRYCIWGSTSNTESQMSSVYAGHPKSTDYQKNVAGLALCFPRNAVGGAFSSLVVAFRAVYPDGSTYALRLFKTKTMPPAKSYAQNGVKVVSVDFSGQTQYTHPGGGISMIMPDTVDPWHFPYQIAESDQGGRMYFQTLGTAATTYGDGPAAAANEALGLDLDFIASWQFADGSITNDADVTLALPSGFTFDPATESLALLLAPVTTTGNDSILALTSATLAR